tara:strand:+ start:1520 stop:1888 length:369 start_codon:yes stop_codon:yes gene_type:complete
MKKNTELLQQNFNLKISYQDVLVTKDKTTFQKPSDSYGEFDHRKNSIIIQEDLSDLDYSCTLIHEILHSLVYYYNLTQPGQPLDEENKEEVVVNAIANGLTATLKENPILLKILSEKLKNVR